VYAVVGREGMLSSDSGVLPLDGNGLPIHGLLPGRSRWDVLHAEVTAAGAQLEARLAFSPDPALLAAFPFPHELRLGVSLRDDALAVETTLSATRGVAVPVAVGLPPHL